MNDGRFRVSDGDTFQVESFSSQATAFRASVRVEYDDGEQAPFEVAHTPNSDRTSATDNVGSRVTRDGRVVSAVMEPAALKRGQCFARTRVLNASQNQVDELNAGYVTGSKSVRLGEFEDSLSGRGFLSWVAAFTGDRAGNAAAVDFDLFATNARRKIYGVVWYYHCSGDVATRTLIGPSLIGLGGTKPTGFTQTGLNAFFWNTGNVTLTANEEGTIASYAATSMGRTVTVDDGVVTTVDTSTAPTPWPLWVTEDEADTLIRFGAITNGEAADTHSAFVAIEEWIDV